MKNLSKCLEYYLFANVSSYKRKHQLNFLTLTISMVLLLFSFSGCQQEDGEDFEVSSGDKSVSFEMETISYLKEASDAADRKNGFIRDIARIPVTQRQKVDFTLHEGGSIDATIQMLEPTRQDIVALHEPLPDDFKEPNLIKLQNDHLFVYDQFGDLIVEVPSGQSALSEFVPILQSESEEEAFSPSLGNLLEGGPSYNSIRDNLEALGAQIEELDGGVVQSTYLTEMPAASGITGETIKIVSIIDETRNLFVMSNIYSAMSDSLISTTAYRYDEGVTGKYQLRSMYQEYHDREQDGQLNTIISNHSEFSAIQLNNF